MAYSHEICLEQEVLNEFLAEVKGFIFRNEHYGNLVMTKELEELRYELADLKNSVFPNDSLEPLREIRKRGREIYEIFKKATPLPHV